MTLHDLRLLCPAIHMRRDEMVCEDCKGGREHNAVVHRCVKESRPASLLAAVETAHQRSRRLYPKTVKTFLCPSRFYRDKYAEWGYPPDRLEHLPNFVDLDEWHPRLLEGHDDRDAYIFFGRVSGEKGLRTLLDAQARWEADRRNGDSGEKPLKLLIAGDGPCLGNVRAGVAKRNLEQVEILGRLDPDGLRKALVRARFSVIPSEWYENAPMAGLESLAMGLPLVGTTLGGLPEMIEEGVTGFTAPPRDPGGLLAALKKASVLGPEARAASRRWAEEHASRQNHMVQLQKHLTAAVETP
jgi:glycosyltransferase involved in cell wall biosynthesis